MVLKVSTFKLPVFWNIVALLHPLSHQLQFDPTKPQYGYQGVMSQGPQWAVIGAHNVGKYS